MIEDSLKDHDNPRHRENAVSAVDILTERNTNGIILRFIPRLLPRLTVVDQYRDIVAPSVSQLLGIVLIESDEDLGSSVKRLFFENFAVSTTESQFRCLHLCRLFLKSGTAKLNRDVFTAISQLVVATATVAGREVIMQLTETR
jgi:hypothetical protein